MEPQVYVAHILLVIVNFSQDKSWHVRCMIANKLYELWEAVGPESTRTELVPVPVQLLRDNEAEVRIAATGKVTKFCRFGVHSWLNTYLRNYHDSSQHVCSALASVTMGMALILGKVQSLDLSVE